MKQRMLNVFTRILRNEYLASVIAGFGYGILKIVYAICKIFLRGQSKITTNEARIMLNSLSNKPDMETDVTNKGQTKDLSIIVPAYNAADTIRECIESVIRQATKYYYELIIINDGSIDNTRDIVESVNDKHIKLINQENRGFSGARNRGIDECEGRYIMFLDSDDMLEGNCIERMMDEIIDNNADIVQGSYFSFVDGLENRQNTLLSTKIIENDLSAMVDNPGFPWAKIYKRELFEDIRFPLDVWFEDTIVCMLLYRLCNKMVVIDEMVYAYRINPEGITKKARHSKKCVDHYWVMEYVLEQAIKLGLPKDDIQYELVSGHMSTLLYRRISLLEDEVVESAFVLACKMLDDIRPEGYVEKGNFVKKDLERAFRTRNYKLWKMASFVV